MSFLCPPLDYVYTKKALFSGFNSNLRQCQFLASRYLYSEAGGVGCLDS